MSQQIGMSAQGTRRRYTIGFTVIELLVIIAVIGILATIITMAYGGFQVRGATTALHSDMKGAAAQLAADKVFTGLYPTSAGGSNGNRGLSASVGTSFEYTYVAAGNSYCLTATSSRKGVPAYRISSSSDTPVEGVCPGHTDPNAPPPPTTMANCFQVSGGMVIGYYDFESNNSSNPACPRAVVMPSVIGGTTITSIGVQAMRRLNLTSVVLAASVTTVASEAFRENSITSLTMPNSVTTLGVGAFRENALTSVTIPSAMTSIGQEAFRYNNISAMVFPSTVTSIGVGAFRENPITSVTVPSSVASIGIEAFRDNSLTSASIPVATTLGSGAFDPAVTITRY